MLGVHVNLSTKSLIGWNECYRATYNTPFNDSILNTTCTSKRILVACRSVQNKSVLTVAGVGLRENIFTPCLVNGYCATKRINSIGFYHVTDAAWGFNGTPEVRILYSYLTRHQLDNSDILCQIDIRICF